MKTEVRWVTPDVAKEMLKRNVSNRKPSEKHIKFLSDEMTKGNWKFDGQPLRFSESGGLLDGQHRLFAIINSKTTQQFLIVAGIEVEAFKVMDTGRTRNGGDVFGINGVVNPAACATTVKIIMAHYNGLHGDATSKSSNTDLWNFFEENRSIEKFVSTSQNLYGEFGRVLPLTTIAAFRFLMAEKNVTDSDDFWKSVCSGLALEKNSPVKILRQKLITDKISKASLPFKEKKAITFKAWNCYRTKKEIKVLRWNKDNEPFPELI